MNTKLKFILGAVLLFSSVFYTRAQTPGGVTNPNYKWAAWLTSDNYSSGVWTNLISDGVGNFTQHSSTNAVSPTKANVGGYNFYPVVKFGKSTNNSAPNRLLSTQQIGILPTENITTIFVIQRESSDYYDYLISFSNTSDYANMGWYVSTATAFPANSLNNGFYYYDNLYYFWPTDMRFGTTSSGAPLRNGILAIDNANYPDASGGTGLQLHRNGLKTNHRAYQWNGTTNVGTGFVALGSYTNAANVNLNSVGYGYEGNIQEVIILKKSGNGNIAVADMQKIQSYLAVKYGITLNNTQNYVNSEGNVVWSRGTNKGFETSIFGLGRDDNTLLNVKQSTSFDPKAATASGKLLTAYLGTLGTLNSDNTATFANDKTYIMFGSNGQSGVESFAINANTAFANTVVSESFDYHYKTTYKTQLTGLTNATVNFKIDKNADPYMAEGVDYMFVSSKDNFLPANTDAYPVVGGIVSNVTIRDGDFIMFAKKDETSSSGSYSPIIWLKTDNLMANADKAQFSPWTSAVGSVSFTQTTTTRPWMNKSTDLMNFHPSVRFESNSFMSATAAALNSGSAYYVFYVSQSEGTHTGNHLVYSMNGTQGNYNGWYQKNPSFSTGNNAVGGQRPYTQTGTNRTYGITAVIRPNSTSMNQTIYFNGNWQIKPGAVLTTTSGTPYIGGTAAATNNFTGNLQELIVYQAPTQVPMSQVDVLKVNSYLAFKYGITLEIGDYIDKNADSFWSRADAVDNAGKRYEYTIFGLGRSDDATTGLGVNQKMARGFKPYPSPFAAFVGAWPSSGLNADNAFTLADNSFLIFSADEQVRNYKIMTSDILAGTTYNNGEILAEDMNYTSAVFQVQAKNWTNVNLVNFRAMIPGISYLLVSNDPEFLPGGTDAYPFDPVSGFLTGPASGGLVIGNGLYVKMISKGDPAPGGVFQELRLWMNPVASHLTVDGSGISQWRDYSSNGHVFNQSTIANRPIYVLEDSLMNYHPSVSYNNPYTGSIQYMSSNKGVMSVSSPAAYTFYTLLNHNSAVNANAYPMGFGSTAPADASSRHPAFGIGRGTQVNGVYWGGGRFYEVNGPSGNSTNQNMFQAASTIIMGHEVTKNVQIRYEFNGYPDISPQTTVGNGSLMATTDGGATLASASTTSRYLVGPMGEIFGYERILEQDEKDAIYSYLGLKYGLTVDFDIDSPDLNFDYVLSDNSVVWPGTSSDIHQKYHNNVAGLIRDDVAALNNKRSHSTAEGSILFMGIGTDGNWTGFNKDKMALIWGHDNTPMPGDLQDAVNLIEMIAFSDEDYICAELHSRFRRTWLVDNSTWQLSDPSDPFSKRITGSERVVIRLDPLNFPIPTGKQYQIFMLVADNEADLYAGSVAPYSDAVNNWKAAIPSTIVNGQYQFEYTFDNKYTYITFGLKELGGGCEGCNFSGNKLLKFVRNTTWTNGATNSSVNLGDNLTADITVTNTNGATFVAGYPRAYTQNTLDIYRRGAKNGVTNVSIKPRSTSNASTPVPSTASFEIYRIGSVSGSRWDEVEIIGRCNGENVYPRLSYMSSNASRRTFKISGNKAIGLRRNPGYTSTDGRMFVEFRFPVEEVIIKYTIGGRTYTGSNLYGIIGIGPITFGCPPPLPPVNEAGLSFLKEAPTTVQLCQTFDYTFHIFNSNCSPKATTFTDVLPEGIVWKELLIEDDSYIANDFVDKRDMKIDNLIIPAGKTLTFKAKVAFTETATAGNYNNTAKIAYKYILNNVEVDDELIAWDRYKGEGQPTTVIATGDYSNDKVKEIEWSFTASKNYYTHNSVITYTLKYENLNDFNISNGALAIQIPEKFELIGGTGGITGDLDLSLYNPEFDPNDNMYYFSGFTLEANTSYTFTFRVNTPDEADLPLEYDPDTGLPLIVDGKNVYANMDTSFDLLYEGSDECIQAAFDNANNTISLPYHEGRLWIITNQHITSNPDKTIFVK